MMLAYRLVRLIENHSEQLANSLFFKIQNSEKTREFRKVPPEEFRQRGGEVYHQLGEWLLGKTESDIEHYYVEMGRRRAVQGLPLSQLIWAIALTKENLMQFLNDESRGEEPAELFGELELLQLLEQFFDRASYYAAVGYERECAFTTRASA